MTLETEVAALTTATTALLNAVNVSKATLDQRVADAAAQVALATAQKSSAALEAAAATASALAASSSAASTAGVVAAAAAYASTAQATNPDSPIRINPRFIAANFTVASAYNAQSTGPITVSDGVTVTIADNATYAIQ